MSKPFKRKGSPYWYITVGGVRQSSGTASYKDAKTLHVKLEKERWDRERLGLKPPRKWEEAVVRYLRECQHQPSYEWKKAILRRWGKHLEGRVLQEITRDFVDDLLDPTPEASSHNNTLNKRVAVIHHVLKKACEEWEWTEKTPKFRTYPIPPAKEKWLTPGQWLTLEVSLPSSLATFCTLALSTGLRSGTLMQLAWAQYDQSRGVLNLRGNKTKRVNSIPLNDTAVAVLEARRRAQVTDLVRVFPELKREPIRQFWRVWERVRKIEGLEGVSPHTLRHTFNTWLAHAGVSKEIREYLMGHTQGDTNAIYTHWAEEQLRPAVKVIDRMLNPNTQDAQAAEFKGR